MKPLPVFLLLVLVGQASGQSITYQGGNDDGSSISEPYFGDLNGGPGPYAGGNGDGHDFSETSVSLGSAGLIDSDSDGMPDSYEVLNGHNPSVADGQSDDDGDGMDNLSEYEFGTDPQDPSDSTRLSFFPGAGLATATLAWPGATGKVYRVYTSEDLVTWFFAGSVPSAPGPITTTVLILDGSPTLFFQVEVNR